MKAVKVTEETAREFCYFFKHMYKKHIKTKFFSFVQFFFSHDLLDLKLLITHDPLIENNNQLQICTNIQSLF